MPRQVTLGDSCGSKQGRITSALILNAVLTKEVLRKGSAEGSHRGAIEIRASVIRHPEDSKNA